MKPALSSLLAIMLAGCAAGPPIELRAALESSSVERGHALRGRVSLHNLTDEPVDVSVPGSPEVALSVWRNGERVGGNNPYVLNIIWEQRLGPHEEYVHAAETIFDRVDLPAGQYELLAELWTHDYGVVSAAPIEFVVLP